MGDDVEVWEYWNSIDSFRMHQGMSLVKGFIPPRDVASLPYEESQEWHHCITTMAEYEKDFDRLLQSLRADLEYGVEFRALTNVDAAYHQIPKRVFITHWRKCGYTVHNKLKTEGSGRPRKAREEDIQSMALKYAASDRDYSIFIKDAAIKYRYEPHTVRNKVSKRQYQKFNSLHKKVEH